MAGSLFGAIDGLIDWFLYIRFPVLRMSSYARPCAAIVVDARCAGVCLFPYRFRVVVMWLSFVTYVFFTVGKVGLLKYRRIVWYRRLFDFSMRGLSAVKATGCGGPVCALPDWEGRRGEGR